MSKNDVVQLIKKFCRDSCRATQGEQVDPFDAMHADVTWNMTGNSPVSGTYEGLENFKAAIGPKLASQFSTGPDFGIYPQEIIVEGDRFSFTARGRGESARGNMYNNSYFFFGEVKDGKIFKIIECYDGALVMNSPFNMRFEEAKPQVL